MSRTAPVVTTAASCKSLSSATTQGACSIIWSFIIAASRCMHSPCRIITNTQPIDENSWSFENVLSINQRHNVYEVVIQVTHHQSVKLWNNVVSNDQIESKQIKGKEFSTKRKSPNAGLGRWIALGPNVDNKIDHIVRVESRQVHKVRADQWTSDEHGNHAKHERKGVIGRASTATSVVRNARFVAITKLDQHNETNQSRKRKAAYIAKAREDAPYFKVARDFIQAED
mmetsp:Transcript_5560/g.10170  ORF Transcript_5560/g.10170 Transcript_5560/m.10170 type:complete len:228 (+) Transcript_5560:218-901(+)